MPTIYEELLRLANRVQKKADEERDLEIAEAWQTVVEHLDSATNIAEGL